MSKKDKKTISSLISGLFLFVGLYLLLIVYKSTNFYFLFALLIITPVLQKVVYLLLPATKSTKKNTRKKKVSKRKNANPPANRLRSDKVILETKLEDFSGREFERLCFLYYKAKGYKPIETGEGADGGVDLIIYNSYHKVEEAIQIKHYINSGNRITVKEIRELNSAKRNHKCLLSSFITTSGYTREALKQADAYKMNCYDLNWVINKIVKWQEQEQR